MMMRSGGIENGVEMNRCESDLRPYDFELSSHSKYKVVS
jgi:hypothetical protein